MDWTAVKITLLPEDLDNAVAALMSVGINGVSINDPRELKDFLDHSIYYDYVDDSVTEGLTAPGSVIFYVQNGSESRETIELAKHAVSMAELNGSFEFSFEEMKEEDWANNWKQFFHPVAIGDKLIIKPSWEHLDDPGDRKILEIDPSSSFGTGGHATTRLCLEFLEEYVSDGCTLLDMGCGSGILGVGAALLGAKKIWAVDIEEGAMDTSRCNYSRNNIDLSDITLICGNVFEDEALKARLETQSFNVIVANIVADVIIGMRELFKKLLAKEGILIVSGIITEREEDVRTALTESGFKICAEKSTDDWVAMALSL